MTRFPAWLAVLIVMMIWSGTFVVIHYSPTCQTSGVIGDSFGAATSLFTGLGLLGLWFTLRRESDAQSEAREHEQLGSRIAAMSAAFEAKAALAHHIDVALGVNAETAANPLEPDQETMLLDVKQHLITELLGLNHELNDLLTTLRNQEQNHGA